MIKKTLSIFLTIILLSNIVNALSINNNLSNDTIYVDDDNTSGPWDGSIEHPYKEIWRGVEGASENDKVFVFSGTYTYVDTTITIDKSITLEGENIDSTIIDGYNKKNIIDISADNVEISGFTIKNSGNGYSGISVSSDSNKIFNNIIKSCTKGIYIESYSKNNNIYDNEFLNCGIETSSLNNNDIYDNTVNGKDLVYRYQISNQEINNAGQVILVSSSNIKIKDCEISNTNIGITILDSTHCNINKNNISNNKYGIYVSSSEGIWVAVESTARTIYNNIFENEIGIYFVNSKGYISNNLIFDNKEGIYITDSSESYIYGNRINGNLEYGIHLKHFTDDCYIYDNYISGNLNSGICIEYSSNQNHIYHNQFYNNFLNAEEYRSYNNVWYTTESGVGSGNFWDDYNEKYPQSGHNGVCWDTPYHISQDAEDIYPLIQPYGNPYPPELSGKKNIKKSTEYTYTAKSTDPRLGVAGYELYYLFDWGNGEDSGWLGPYQENREVKVKYTFAEEGSYEIKAKVKNKYDWTSGWSEPLHVNVAKSKIKTYKDLNIRLIILNFLEKLSFEKFF